MANPTEHEFDVELRAQDIQSLSSADGVTAFFSRLGYDTNSRLEQSPDNLGITAETTRRPIRRIERIADQEGLFQVYLFELTSVTVAETRALTRAFRNLSGNFLLVLTASDFERLDFVLLERHIPSGPARSGIGTRQAGIRPRALTVDRRNADRIQLRVLRRLTWTEADPFAQFDKIQSAYAVADWSEEYFNNRALFSDYFLLERLRDFEEWREDPKPAYRALRDLYRGASARLAGEKEIVLRERLLEPALEVLGFTLTSGKEAGSGSAEPDYRLISPEGGTAPPAFCLAYPWDRFLDGKDYRRDAESPEENPGALVVSLLEGGEAPWAIVTNGRLWRLYSQKTYAKATNYYEIDIEEVLAQAGPHAPDPSEAFRYFWLLFRRAAFVEEQENVDGAEVLRSFLDRLLQGSEDYAKELGARLKDRVFIDVFPHLADGFISDFRSSRPSTGNFAEPELAAVFEGTLTLLYRLLFLLYAEARDLLPVKEVRGYYEASLKKIKAEVAKAAGEIGDQVAGELKRAYGTDSFALYERLRRLCRMVDQGESSLNVPFYNGGLFISDPALEDDDPESQAARFLDRYRVPDRHLALAIDLLSRDIDTRRQSLVFIDYKSLGVRQLGSIYEGLLEFKLRTAEQKLGVVKSKEKEVYRPFRDLTDRQKAQAKRNNKVVQKGQIYLENDKRERKATGSYYTPDHIVKYIVQEVVGPLISEKLEALRPKLREAQTWHRAKLAQAEAKGERSDKYRYGQAVVTRWAQELIDPVFDIKVLDPAMGSGHFLVETVDFVTDKLIDFLTAFPWNPVLAHLEWTRETILKEMDRQEVSVDPSRLTDVNLLKRHVLKRCVYGVDLNPMAVELAKVSLWLHCFTLGAPLSFLDHHLRCGNSLLGTTVEEVDEILSEKGQLTLSASSAWQGLLEAVQGMIKVGGLPDVTVEQVTGSRAVYQDAIFGLRPFKKILDVHLTRWFVESEIDLRGRTRADPYSEVLRNPELLDWANEKASPTLDSSPNAELLGHVESESREWQFFHWELEFPEVYYAPNRESQPGFHAVVGNPPYDVLTAGEGGPQVASLLRCLVAQSSYSAAASGVRNLYKFFICRGRSLCQSGGFFSFIVPMTLMGDYRTSELRAMLLSETSISRIEVFPQKDDPKRRVFPEAKLSTIIFVVQNSAPTGDFVVRTHPGAYVVENSQELRVSGEMLTRYDPNQRAIPSCSTADWAIVEKILASEAVPLGSVAECFRGDIEETREVRAGTLHVEEVGPMALRGSNITCYAVREASQGNNMYVDIDKLFKRLRPDAKAVRNFGRRKIGYQRSSPQNNFRRIIAAPLPEKILCLDTVSYITEESTELDLDFLLALLNSKILDWYFRLSSSNSKVGEYQFNSLLVPRVEKEEGSHVPVEAESDVEDLSETLIAACTKPGVIPEHVVEEVARLSQRIQEIEQERTVTRRSDRALLDSQSEELQKVIDQVLFHCYGIGNDARFVEARLEEML